MEFSVKFETMNGSQVLKSPATQVGLILLQKARMQIADIFPDSKIKMENIFPASKMRPYIIGIESHSLSIDIDEAMAEESGFFYNSNAITVIVDPLFLNKFLEIKLYKEIDETTGSLKKVWYKYRIYDLDVLIAWKQKAFPEYWEKEKE